MSRIYSSILSVFVLGAFAFVAAPAPAQDGNIPEKETVTIEKTLPNGGTVVVKKVGQEAAYATITIDGKSQEIDAFEPLSQVPEAARAAVEEAWNELGEIPKKTIKVDIDVSEAPDAAEWAERARSRVLYWYPKVVAMLDGEEAVDKIPDDFTIKLIFKDMDGVAYAAGRTITVSTRHIKRNPKDFGLVVHETTHVAQAYPGVRETWAMEGATDYIRYYVTEARSNNHWAINPRTSKYTDSYGVTASFYDWIVRTLDPDFMKKLHRVFRIRGSVELFFVEEYGKSCQELWDEYVASLTKETR